MERTPTTIFTREEYGEGKETPSEQITLADELRRTENRLDDISVVNRFVPGLLGGERMPASIQPLVRDVIEAAMQQYRKAQLQLAQSYRDRLRTSTSEPASPQGGRLISKAETSEFRKEN